jgi:histidinol-phosphatase (PHP family)
MPLKADCHLHSSYSGDSDEPMEKMILRAIELGLTQMCFTEHMDMNFPVTATTPEGFFFLDTEAYQAELSLLKEKYAKQIKIFFGVELGTALDLIPDLYQYAKSYDFDFVIASSHLANGKDPYQPEFFEGRSDREAFREYFEAIRDNLMKFSDFDVYAHLDYVVRHGKNKDRDYVFSEYSEIFEDILTVLVNNGKGIEINTAALRYGMREAHPCTAVIKRYRELGGEIITVGSDAHKAADITSGFDFAAAALKDCGFDYYTIFEGRKAEFVKL